MANVSLMNVKAAWKSCIPHL